MTFKNKFEITGCLFLFFGLLLFSCKESKIDNCIADMQIKFICNVPGADVVVFKMISNHEQLSLDFDSFNSIKVIFSDRVFTASAQFELEKWGENDYSLTWMTPYFAQHGCHTEKEFYDFYKKNASLKIVLSNGKDTFTFTKCTK
ncbi:conserved hypothetical protein [Flavobacterium sp. 9AF]|uniref:hypothetical protein n=1 Tax=Flavobacterium sp. 9AF TaxID=2653142 RepID=UPI0012EEED4C|nr:hypothetical protein [Flavobacterium sp. 9AF]VXC19115.1 conserved hypothetical protein [Flavobacterium sp. 9AF]